MSALSIRLGAAVVVLLAIAGIVGAIYHAGGAKVTAKVEAEHAASVADARHDEQGAATSSAAIGADLATRTVAQAAVIHQTIEDLRNALPPVDHVADAGKMAVDQPAAPPAVLDVERVRAPLDALVDRANRAADAADALP